MSTLRPNAGQPRQFSRPWRTAATLAAKSDVSVSALILLESGSWPRRSRALRSIENTLAALEAEGADGGEA